MMYTLRFDVETLIIATASNKIRRSSLLRFDVETLIIATQTRSNMWYNAVAV